MYRIKILPSLNACLLSLFCLFTLQAEHLSHEADTSAKDLFIQYHKEYLCQGSGIWMAVNPTYDSLQQYSPRKYKYEIRKGIHSEVISIEIWSYMKETGWWLSWDGFYLWDPVESETVYKALASHGATSQGSVFYPSMDESINIFTIRDYEGKKRMYKDVSSHISETVMISKSYELTPIGEWKFQQELRWIRQ